MTPEEIRKIVLAFPGAEDGVSYGQPSFKVNNKFFTRLLAEDQSMVLLEISQDERDMLMEAEPETFHITDHYRGYPIVLARLASVDAAWLHAALEKRWLKLVPKSVSKAYVSP